MQNTLDQESLEEIRIFAAITKNLSEELSSHLRLALALAAAFLGIRVCNAGKANRSIGKCLRANPDNRLYGVCQTSMSIFILDWLLSRRHGSKPRNSGSGVWGYVPHPLRLITYSMDSCSFNVGSTMYWSGATRISTTRTCTIV